MAATKFAMPVAHEEVTAITPGRNFHQAVAGKPANTVPGLEMFLPEDGKGPNIYACFDGNLEWHQSLGSTPNRLVLKPDQETVAKRLREVPTLEAAPRELVYENVDSAATKLALIEILTKGFASTKANPSDKTKWHPAMTQRVTVKETTKLDSSKIYDALKLIDGDAAKTNVYYSLLSDRFIIEPPGNVLVRVKAGEVIGAADVSAWGGATGKERQLAFYMIDSGGQRINPLFYFSLYLANAKTGSAAKIEILTSDACVASIHSAFPKLDPDNVPPPREPMIISGVSQDSFAYGELETLHGTPKSKIKWLYNGNDKLEASDKGELIPDSVATLPDTPSVREVWKNAGQQIANLCKAFQVPCETVVAVCAGESSGQSGVYVLLPLSKASLKRPEAAANAALLVKYEKMLGSRVDSYEPWRNALSPTFGDKVTTTLKSCSLETTTVDIGRNGMVGTDRCHFIVQGIYRPEVVSNGECRGLIHIDIELTEERFSRKIKYDGAGSGEYYYPGPPDPARAGAYANFADAKYTAARSGVIRQLRVRPTDSKNGPMPVDVIIEIVSTESGGESSDLKVILKARSPGVSVTDHHSKVVYGGVSSFALKVTASRAIPPIDVEWFLGFEGTDQSPTTPEADSMYVIAAPRGTGNGLAKIPTAPWVGGDEVAYGRKLTWDDLANVLNATGGDMMAAGVAQTLVSTAWGMFDTLKAYAPSIASTLGIVRPATRGDFIRTGWLLVPNNGLFIGIALMRLHYRSGLTNFDLPKVSAQYFGGKIPSREITRWGVGLPTENWADILGRRYNAAVEMFKDATLTAKPTVRFKHQ